jgi:hypothetical protein
MKERPTPDKVANELSGASVFFRRPAAPADADPAPNAQVSAPAPPASAAAPTAAPATRTGVRPGRPTKRQMIRHPFELYMDQLERLRERAEDQRRRGEPGSMSRMVREAIDRFLDSPDVA